MIIACSSCSAQYSVPDAKVRGKLVRITCKHCAAGIVFDGREMAADGESALHSALLRMPMPQPESADASSDGPSDEDVTMVARSKFGEELSVHEELTVIGQMPKEVLETERLFAQRTQPPPERGTSPVVPATPATERPSALPEMPEMAVDDTKAASPRAFARSEPPARIAPLPLPSSPPPRSPLPPLPAPRAPLPVQHAPHEPTLVSHGLADSLPPLRSPMARRVRVALLVLLVVAVALLVVINQRPH